MKGSPIRATLLMELANTGGSPISRAPVPVSTTPLMVPPAWSTSYRLSVLRMPTISCAVVSRMTSSAFSSRSSPVTFCRPIWFLMRSASSNEILRALAPGMSLPFVDLNEYQIDKEVISMVPDDLCRRNQLLPLSIVNGRIAVAMANPKNFAAVDDVSATTGMPVIAMVAMPSQVRDCINRFLRANAELTELSHEIAATAKKKSTLNKTTAKTPPPWHAS